MKEQLKREYLMYVQSCRDVAAEKFENWLMDRYEKAINALVNIADPIKYLAIEAEKDGFNFDGHAAIQLIKEPSFYQEIARTYLRTSGQTEN